jgi:HPt (histidine-containing phosphotransfer) domain-containing protein
MATAIGGGEAGRRGAKPASASRTKRPVDLAHLARQTMGDRALEQEVLGLFVKQALTIRERLAGADAAERRRLAHSLKGAALSIGAVAVSDCLALIEADPDDADAQMRRLPGLIDEVRDFVAATHR